MAKCPICRSPANGFMCRACGKAFDRFKATRADDGSIFAVIEWAAKRTRMFDRSERDFRADMQAVVTARKDRG